MTTPPPDLGQLGLFADAIRLHVFLRAAYRTPEAARRSVALTSRALLGGGQQVFSETTLANLAVVIWHLDQCLRDGAFSLPLVLSSLPNIVRGGAVMPLFVSVCERLGLPPCTVVAEASRSLVEASFYAARQAGAGVELEGTPVAVASPCRSVLALPPPPVCCDHPRIPLVFPGLEHKPTMCGPVWRTRGMTPEQRRALRPAGWASRPDEALNPCARQLRARARRAALAGQKAPKSLMLCCAQQSPAPQTQGDPVPGHPAAEAQATEAPGTPPPPPSATPDGGQIGPAVGLDAPPEDSKTLAGNELASEESKSDKKGPES